jgi:hypothetical protein
VKEKPPVPLRYWVLWWAILVVADVVFYVLLTPIWIGLRAVAWLAEFRSRRRRPGAEGRSQQTPRGQVRDHDPPPGLPPGPTA